MAIYVARSRYLLFQVKSLAGVQDALSRTHSFAIVPHRSNDIADDEISRGVNDRRPKSKNG